MSKTSPAPPNTKTMQCMEVWGGNHLVERHMAMGGLDAWILSRPMSGSRRGGDVHYLSSCATGRISRMLLADVSGHGEEVATVSNELRKLMRRFVNFIDQSHFVSSLNRSFLSLDIGGTFATALVMSWFGPTSELTISNAGHPDPIVYDHETACWTFLSLGDGPDDGTGSRNIPFGVLEDVSYDEVHHALHAGDLFLAYTDGLIEALGEGSARHGQESLLAWLNDHRDIEPGELVHRLVELVRDRSEDDVSLIVLSPNESRPWESLRAKLEMPLHLIRGFWLALKDRDHPIPWPQLSIANLGGAIIDRLNRLRRRT